MMPRAGLEPAVIHSVPMAFSRLGVLIGVHRCKSMGLLTGDDGVGIGKWLLFNIISIHPLSKDVSIFFVCRSVPKVPII